MELGAFLAQSTKLLQAAGVETARLDCLILLEDALGMDRAPLLAHLDKKLTDAQVESLHRQITRRATHVPLAYIRGKVAFYGREFAVNEHVLVPRPETEQIIDFLQTIRFEKPPRIADVGTGSGCIGITDALELPGSQVYLLDIDPAALEVAQRNADRLHATVHIQKADLLAGVSAPFDVVLANLPYVPSQYPVNKAAAFEPRLALFSGDDGLDHFRTFWQQLADLPHKPQHVLTESMPDQHPELARLAGATGYVEHQREAFVQHFTLAA